MCLDLFGHNLIMTLQGCSRFSWKLFTRAGRSFHVGEGKVTIPTGRSDILAIMKTAETTGNIQLLATHAAASEFVSREPAWKEFRRRSDESRSCCPPFLRGTQQ